MRPSRHERCWAPRGARISRCPIARLVRRPTTCGCVVELIRRVRPRAIAIPYWQDRHPDHRAAASLLRDAVFNAKLRRYDAGGEPWQPSWVCHYFINDAGPASFVVDVSGYYDKKRQALACYTSQFTRATAIRGNASELPELQPADREPRRAVRRAGWCTLCRGHSRARAGRSRTSA